MTTLWLRGRIVMTQKAAEGVITIFFEHDLLINKPNPVTPLNPTAEEMGQRVAEAISKAIGAKAVSNVLLSDEDYADLGRPGVGHVFKIGLEGPVKDENP